jgi:hypothetical protein
MSLKRTPTHVTEIIDEKNLMISIRILRLNPGL